MNDQVRQLVTADKMLNADGVWHDGHMVIVLMAELDDLSSGRATVAILPGEGTTVPLIAIGPSLYAIAMLDLMDCLTDFHQLCMTVRANTRGNDVVFRSLNLSAKPWRARVRQHASSTGTIKVGLKDRLMIVREDLDAMLRDRAEAAGESADAMVSYQLRLQSVRGELDALQEELARSEAVFDMLRAAS